MFTWFLDRSPINLESNLSLELFIYLIYTPCDETLCKYRHFNEWLSDMYIRYSQLLLSDKVFLQPKLWGWSSLTQREHDVREVVEINIIKSWKQSVHFITIEGDQI